jgi:hypothetical protein
MINHKVIMITLVRSCENPSRSSRDDQESFAFRVSSFQLRRYGRQDDGRYMTSSIAAFNPGRPRSIVLRSTQKLRRM